MPLVDRSVFTASPSDPVTVYYCKANLKTGNTVRIVQGRNVADTTGCTFSASGIGFHADMIHGNSSGKAKASGARCVLRVTWGTVTPAA
jgi:pyruvoyl-dependent arginine decarboxylase (PvlArgDC)